MFVSKSNPLVFTFFQRNYSASTKRKRNIHLHPYPHEIATINFNHVSRVDYVAKDITNLLRNFDIHISKRQPMNLHLKICSIKLEGIQRSIIIVTFHDHKMGENWQMPFSKKKKKSSILPNFSN